ncbi:unnamed protein product [Caenorhabditis bovis]|uniref:CCHC-type domain-containing protein n=1 Tax=Caenorhabditis bovis TaxID=2654633 RepID=A0A8S1F115_9PELO|nr:unnamed protein product [Caenorhabditis bovis]
MAEDIGFEPMFEDIEETKPKKKEKKKKAERSAPENSTEEAPVEESGEKVLTKSAKKKLKRKLSKEKNDQNEKDEKSEKNDENIEEPEEKKSKVQENLNTKDKKPKAKFQKKNKELSFEAIENKFCTLLSKLTETTSKFNEGEELIKKQVEEGKITEGEAETLYRVYNRNLRLKRYREVIIRALGENADLFAVKNKVNSMVEAKKVTRADAGVLIKRWKAKETRRIGRQNEKSSRSACFHCREPGHLVSECPKKSSSDGDGICFKCGSTEHSIYSCKKKNIKGFPFSTCFVCKQMGHLSRDCHQNLNGVYPNGGSCNVCGSIAHLKRNCPELAAQKAGINGEKKKFVGRASTNLAQESADMDYDPTESAIPEKKPVRKMPKHIKF